MFFCRKLRREYEYEKECRIQEFRGLSEDTNKTHKKLASLLSLRLMHGTSPGFPELTSGGYLRVPYELCADLYESYCFTHPKGSQVIIAKVVYRKFRSFSLSSVFKGDRTRALALIGRDEAGQFWQHFLPDDYMDRNIVACERYLMQAGPEDRLVWA